MTLTCFLKKIMFWPHVRKQIIMFSHWRCSRYCRQLINDACPVTELPDFGKTISFTGKKIIWQYWSQGFNDPMMPKIVRMCLESVDRYCSDDDYIIIRLDDKNIHDYISFPKYVSDNINLYPKAFFSDLLRCMLLYKYGGCWLDATVFLSDHMPDTLWNKPFFLYERSQKENNKKYWENAFAYYYGWDKRFKVNVLSSIIFSHHNNEFLGEIVSCLLNFWGKKDKLPNYFLLQILYNELKVMKGVTTEEVSDCIPHYLQQFLYDPEFNLMSFEEILKMTSIHKLSYKNSDISSKLKSLLYTCATPT